MIDTTEAGRKVGSARIFQELTSDDWWHLFYCMNRWWFNDSFIILMFLTSWRRSHHWMMMIMILSYDWLFYNKHHKLFIVIVHHESVFKATKILGNDFVHCPYFWSNVGICLAWENCLPHCDLMILYIDLVCSRTVQKVFR